MATLDATAPAPAERERALAPGAALVTVSLRASAFVGIRSASRQLSPEALALGRLTIASAAFDAGTAAMLVNVGPIVIALLAGFVLREGFPRRLLARTRVRFAGDVACLRVRCARVCAVRGHTGS